MVKKLKEGVGEEGFKLSVAGHDATVAKHNKQTKPRVHRCNNGTRKLVMVTGYNDESERVGIGHDGDSVSIPINQHECVGKPSNEVKSTGMVLLDKVTAPSRAR